MIVDHIHDYRTCTQSPPWWGTNITNIILTIIYDTVDTTLRTFPLHWSLLPLANAGLSPTLLNLSLSSQSSHPIIIDLLYKILKKIEGGPPLFPPWQWSHSVAFRIRAEAGACTSFRKKKRTNFLLPTKVEASWPQTQRRHFRVSWPLEEDWYPRILIPSTSEFSTFLHSRLPTNLLPCAPTPQWNRNLLSFV